VVVFREPAERIVEAARDEQCDLIAMSAHARNVVRWAFLGSVADR
jgi:nucleotide-binding universal stress UspA family protein